MSRFLLPHKRVWFRAYKSQALVVGLGIGCVNAYNNYQIVREYNNQKQQCRVAENEMMHTVKSYCSPVIIGPLTKGILYGLLAPLSTCKIAWDQYYHQSSSHHLSFNYDLFSLTKFKLAQQKKLIGIQGSDINFTNEIFQEKNDDALSPLAEKKSNKISNFVR